MATQSAVLQPSLTLKRRLKAPPAKVFAAWTDPEKMTRWMGPGEIKTMRAESDTRVGGHYRIVMQAPNVGKEGLQTGDLIFFATNGGSQVSHAGIYVGEGRFVHAPATGGTVKLDSLSKAYWQKAYLSAKRVLQPEHLAHNP